MSAAGRTGSPDHLTAALAEVQRCASSSGDALLHLVPDTGDLVTGRVVDAFVEQASDALRALVESLGEEIGRRHQGDA